MEANPADEPFPIHPSWAWISPAPRLASLRARSDLNADRDHTHPEPLPVIDNLPVTTLWVTGQDAII